MVTIGTILKRLPVARQARPILLRLHDITARDAREWFYRMGADTDVVYWGSSKCTTMDVCNAVASTTLARHVCLTFDGGPLKRVQTYHGTLQLFLIDLVLYWVANIGIMSTCAALDIPLDN